VRGNGDVDDRLRCFIISIDENMSGVQDPPDSHPGKGTDKEAEFDVISIRAYAHTKHSLWILDISYGFGGKPVCLWNPSMVTRKDESAISGPQYWRLPRCRIYIPISRGVL
jgi:hypothetical protein